MFIDDIETLTDNIPNIIAFIFSIGLYLIGIMMVYTAQCALCGL